MLDKYPHCVDSTDSELLHQIKQGHRDLLVVKKLIELRWTYKGSPILNVSPHQHLFIILGDYHQFYFLRGKLHQAHPVSHLRILGQGFLKLWKLEL